MTLSSTGSGSGPAFYAFTLGLVAALNPCGFPMLPAWLALFSGPRTGRPASVAGALRAGAAVSTGFVAVFGVIGLVFEAGATLATGWLPPLMAAAGIAMAVAGVSTLSGHPPVLRLPAPRLRPGRSLPAMVLYGVIYALGSLSCSLPLFLASVAGSFTGHGFLGGLWTYLAYALGMGLLITAAAVITTVLGTTALRHAGRAGRWLPAISGTTLILSGAYLAYYWLAELLDPAGSPPLAAFVQQAPGWVATRIAAHPTGSALVLGVLVLGPIAVVTARILAQPHEPPSLPQPTSESGKRNTSQ